MLTAKTKTMKMTHQTAPLTDVFQYRITRAPATIWLGLMMRYYKAVSSCDAKTRRTAYFAEVDQSRGETESGVDASRSVTGETLLGGVSSGHFSQGQHDTEA